jgi:DNA-binding CsgD family transcriptional regulator
MNRVLELTREGYSAAAIAAELCVSERTVVRARARARAQGLLPDAATIAGWERARTAARVREAWAQGLSIRAIARRLYMSRETIRRILSGCQPHPRQAEPAPTAGA